MVTRTVTHEGTLRGGVHFYFSISLHPDHVQQASINEVLAAYCIVLANLVAEVVANNAATIAASPEVDYQPSHRASVGEDGLDVDLTLTVERAVPIGMLEVIAEGVLGSFLYLHMSSNTQRALEARCGCSQLAGHLNTMRQAEKCP